MGKATKANSKATTENKTEKGEKADNIKASHSVDFMVTKDNAKSKDDVKDMKATKAASKATTENKTEKGEKADELKSEKATKANSKATTANKTEKGEKADNIKASHSVSGVSHKSAFSAYMGGGKRSLRGSRRV